MQSTQSNTRGSQNIKKIQFQLESLLCLDKCSVIDGSTIFHEAAKVGNLQLIEYLLRVFKKRNEQINSLLQDHKQKKSLKNIKNLDALMNI